MLVQSIHSFEHLQQLLQEKECHHKYTGKTEISHQHHPFDHCFVCEFTFTSFVSKSPYDYTCIEHHNSTAYFSFYSKEILLQFKGSLFALRAPPTV
jgi:hypothetical protein